jgi:uncharacterized membrane protein YeaQ/YmgE (transglycosylase-associated protein family)
MLLQDAIWDYVTTLLVGALLGTITNLLAPGRRPDVALDVLLGISGGLVGSRIAEILLVPDGFSHIRQIGAAFGAVIFLWGWRITRQHGRF